MGRTVDNDNAAENNSCCCSSSEATSEMGEECRTGYMTKGSSFLRCSSQFHYIAVRATLVAKPLIVIVLVVSLVLFFDRKL